MAIMVSMFWAPNTTGAVPQLRENLLAFREVSRAIGYTCDIVGLIPGGGGAQGEMGIVLEFEGEAYAEWLDADPDPRMVGYQQGLKASDSRPSRSSTLMEVPGAEVPYGDLPKKFLQVSLIEILPGKTQAAVADVTKSQQIMGRLGIRARVAQTFLADPWPRMAFIQYFESGADWSQKSGALGADDEWQSHFGKAHENRHIVRQAAYGMEP